MPHKHTRSRIKDDSNFDLPPEIQAKPLPVGNQRHLQGLKGSKTKLKKERLRKAEYDNDDTPKAFARLMRMQDGKRKFDGLDNGPSKGSKKSKRIQQASSHTNALTTMDAPKILPHERLSDFAARVNQAIPIARAGRTGRGTDGISRRHTLKEKRMQNMVADWKKQNAARRAREEEAQEIAEEEEEELEASMEASTGYTFVDGGKKKRKRVGNDEDEQDDPWAVLKETRYQPKGLHDVAQAPPSFRVIPQEKFKIKNGAQVQVGSVPNAAGSLRRREELEKTRNDVIKHYRKMLNDKRDR